MPVRYPYRQRPEYTWPLRFQVSQLYRNRQVVTDLCRNFLAANPISAHLARRK